MRVHVHGVGRCDAPAFDSAGPHWNPTDAPARPAQSAWAPISAIFRNLSVGTDGAGAVEFTIPGASLRSAASMR